MTEVVVYQTVLNDEKRWWQFWKPSFKRIRVGTMAVTSPTVLSQAPAEEAKS